MAEESESTDDDTEEEEEGSVGIGSWMMESDGREPLGHLDNASKQESK